MQASANSSHPVQASFSTSLTSAGHTPQAYDVHFQIQHLEEMMVAHLKKLGNACSQLEGLEQELHSFLDEYYGQVGCYFEQLETMRAEIARYDREIRASRRKSLSASTIEAMEGADKLLRENFPSMPHDLSKAEIDAEVKDIYRRLMKLYHPDTAGDSRYNHTIVQLINKAYKRGNLWALREMEHRLVEHAYASKDLPEDKLARIRERFEAITTSLMRVQERYHRLQTSAVYRLKKRLDGENLLMEVIIHRAKAQVEETRKLLFRKKLDHHALVLS